MNYAEIRNYDIANGEGVRTSLFVSGCTNHCPGCFNPEEQDFSFGKLYTQETVDQICELLKNPVTSGLSILGGDPLCQDENGIKSLMRLCFFTHAIGKTVWLWTGFVWEDIFRNTGLRSHRTIRQSLLCNCDVVVDGPFIQELSDRALKWRGSANQRVIDVDKTMASGKVVLYEE